MQSLFSLLRNNAVSFIDTLLQFETNNNNDYRDDKLLNLRLDFNTFNNISNVKIIIANSYNSEKAVRYIIEKNKLNAKVKTINLFYPHGKTNAEYAEEIFNVIKPYLKKHPKLIKNTQNWTP